METNGRELMIQEYLQRKIEESYEVLKVASEMSKEYYEKPLIVTYSGGKDSDVLLQLALECLSPDDFEVINNHTTVDAPETVYYIRKTFKRLKELGIKATIQYPHYKDGKFKSMWTLIEDNLMPPTRLARYCCRELKETTMANSFRATGVREAESVSRKGREIFTVRVVAKKDAQYFSLNHIKEVFEDDKARRKEAGITNPNEEGVYDCVFITKAKQKDDLMCSPIYKWTDREVWDFIHERKMDYNPLYDKGFWRVGCIGCPLAGNQVKVLNQYPKYKQNYINAFNRMIKRREETGKTDQCIKHNWKDGESVYRWWIEDKTIEGQMNIFDFIGKEEESK